MENEITYQPRIGGHVMANANTQTTRIIINARRFDLRLLE